MTNHVAADGHADGNMFLCPLQRLCGTVLYLLQQSLKVIANVPRKSALVFWHMDVVLIQSVKNILPGLTKATGVHDFCLVNACILVFVHISGMIEMALAGLTLVFLCILRKVSDVGHMIFIEVDIHQCRMLAY